MSNQKKIHRATQSISIGLLIFFGFQLAVSLHNKVHNILHDHGFSQLHSIQNENDPCHRAVFHHDQKYHCHHEGHLEKASKKCKYCFDFLASKDQEIQKFCISNALEFVNIDFTIQCISAYDSKAEASSRGPPIGRV